MTFNYHKRLIIDIKNAYNMPPMEITPRRTDLSFEYSKSSNRFDRIAANVYGDDELGVLIRWANPEYDLEFDIPNGSVIRVPLPLDAVLEEVFDKIERRKNK